MRKVVFIGYDPRERPAFEVAVASLQARAKVTPDIRVVDLRVLQERGVYQRPIVRRNGQLVDLISEAPMSTEFALSRFFVPLLATEWCAEPWDWAVFMDCDVLLRADIDDLFALADPRMAVQCVQHEQTSGAAQKMDGQTQTFYARKNWSSVMLLNLHHPAMKALTPEKLNHWTGRALHGFNWLEDVFIGALPADWNHLVGVTPPNPDAKLVHYTLGVPNMAGYANCEHSGEWWQYLRAVSTEATAQRC